MKQIVIINGTGGCGKDTFVQFASQYANVMNYSSVQKVKEMAKIAGWNGEKTEKDRKFLCDLKKLTTEYNDLSFHEIIKKIAEFQHSSESILFIHIKEPREIERVVKRFNAKTLLIKREGISNILSNEADALVEEYQYDDIIKNDTLENLQKEALLYVEKITGGKNEYR